MMLLQKRIIHQRKISFSLLIMLLTSFNLYSQEVKLNSEEKYQERLNRHNAQLLAEKDSLRILNEKNISDSTNTNSFIINDNSKEKSSSFPTFVDTGNPEQDNINYRLKKDQWIKENPETYKKMHQSVPLTEEQQKENDLKKQSRLNKQ